MNNRNRSDKLAEEFRDRMFDKVYSASYREITIAGVVVILCAYFAFK